MRADCSEVPVDDARWLGLVEMSDPSVFHTPAWAGVLADAYGFETRVLLATSCDGTVLGGMPVVHVTAPGARRIVSVPFADACDPLLVTADAWPVLAGGLQRCCVPVHLRCTASPAVLADPSFRVVSRARHHTLPLTNDPDKLRAGFSAAAQRAIRKAERAGVEVARADDEEFLEVFLRLHVALRKHKYRLLAQPLRFLEAMRDRFAPSGDWFPMIARHGGRAIAATLYLRSGSTLVYKFNASDPEHLVERPNNLLVWAGVRLGCALGCEALDFGASDDDQPGLIRFKESFGTVEGEITRLRYEPPGWDGGPERASAALLGDVTRLLVDPRVPDEVTAEAGARLYRYFA